MVLPLLDTYSGAGGAAEGYRRAGFTPFGIDIEPQPRYPFPFLQMDALKYLKWLIAKQKAGIELPWVAIHASPPCQAWSDLQKQNKRLYADFIKATRELLLEIGLPYIIENVEGAPLLDPVKFCGASPVFKGEGLRVIRHRLFEANFPLPGTPCPRPRHPLVFTHDKRKPHFGKLDEDTAFVQVTGGGNCSVANARAAMGIDWMLKREINEAIPPAYTEEVGRWLMKHIASGTNTQNQPSGGKTKMPASGIDFAGDTE